MFVTNGVLGLQAPRKFPATVRKEEEYDYGLQYQGYPLWLKF